MLRLTLVTLSLLLAGLATLALVPAASARGVCSDAVDEWCAGTVCVIRGESPHTYWYCPADEPIIVCIREPCPGPPQ